MSKRAILTTKWNFERSLITFFFIFAFFSFSFAEDPWGKDADLTAKINPSYVQRRCKTPVIGPIGEKLIQFHQNVISPADGPRSHFLPSSSQYTLDAMRRYGFFNGFFLGCDRLMRENSEEWVYKKVNTPQGTLKWDPVK